MTALVLENLPALPTLGRNLRALLARLGRRLDVAVGSLAARKLPEWQMCEVQREIEFQTAQIRNVKAGS